MSVSRVVFVSRQLGADAGSDSGGVAPAPGDGIGARCVAQILNLAEIHEVTVITTSLNASVVEQLRQQAPNVDWLLVEEPEDETSAGFYNRFHHWSASVFARICELIDLEGPVDYIEFTDFQGTAMVTVQAKQTADPRFAATRIGVRLTNNSEIFHVLNGELPDDPQLLFLFDMERYSLAHADVVTHAAGEEIRGLYERFYAGRLAPSMVVEHVSPVRQSNSELPSPSDQPLRLLYIGRLQRIKGVDRLVEALAGSGLEGWELTIVGADTPTGSLATSMVATLEQLAGSDPRIKLRSRVPNEEIPGLIQAHDAVVIPSVWECHPNAGLEAFANNRPVLASPVGGCLAMVEDSVTGYIAQGNSARDFERVVERALANRDELMQMAKERAPLTRYRELADIERFRASIDRVIEVPIDRPAGTAPHPASVSVVIPYFALSGFVERTVSSVIAQGVEVEEILIVNDGSIAAEDAILTELAEDHRVEVLTTYQRGPSAARNFGIRQTSGEFVLLIDGDDTLQPEFLARAVLAMQSDPRIGYVSSWLRYVDAEGRPCGSPGGYFPLGNDAASLDHGVACSGGSTMLLRRSMILGLHFNEQNLGTEDTGFHRLLRQHGVFGHVIPEQLINYRVRAESGTATTRIPNSDRLARETAAQLRQEQLQWAQPPATAFSSGVANNRSDEQIEELTAVNARLQSALARAEAGEAEYRSPLLKDAREAADRAIAGGVATADELKSWIARESALAEEGEELEQRSRRVEGEIALISPRIGQRMESRGWKMTRPLRAPRALAHKLRR